jgi:hypothetical protein
MQRKKKGTEEDDIVADGSSVMTSYGDEGYSLGKPLIYVF